MTVKHLKKKRRHRNASMNQTAAVDGVNQIFKPQFNLDGFDTPSSKLLPHIVVLNDSTTPFNQSRTGDIGIFNLKGKS